MRLPAFDRFCVSAVLLLLAGCAVPAGSNLASTPAKITYGSDSAAGGTFTHDGVKLYYETRGEGEPLLLIHGNGGNIASLWKQIDYFKRTYKVIAMDSREQGSSGSSPGPLTYEKMADDLAALLDHLRIESAHVLGWSDGGINGMLLALRHPRKVKKLAAMAPNLNPKGMHPEAEAFWKGYVGSITPQARTTPEGARKYKVLEIVLSQPNIKPSELARLTAPTLILAGDHDMITAAHAALMFEALPNGQLAVFPNTTHMLPYDDPAAFNATVDRFFRTPFVKRDRMGDTVKTFEQLLRDIGAQ
jgi:pimeloyl-ACP methyl ester carboxylesterase